VTEARTSLAEISHWAGEMVSQVQGGSPLGSIVASESGGTGISEDWLMTRLELQAALERANKLLSES